MRAARREDFGNFKADSGIGTGDKKAAAGLGRHIVGRKSPAHRLFPLFFRPSHPLHFCDRSKPGSMVRLWAILAHRPKMMSRAIAHLCLPPNTVHVAPEPTPYTVARPLP